MLFAKLLGRLRGKRASVARGPQPTTIASNPAKPHRTSATPQAGETTGFDPYNSGSFDAKPWERIKRR